ncbi:helix-turn-helix domain-containing protein [Mycobacterium riyadhense]|uniref:helix-turn-helix domain-containing protein n=1 Tax=Mycobacterium riyadhense TaxID=486698 RepID=UPI001957D685|nr:helix-turn-helix domain-containing protein [Mycobacterium riyadhense]
MFTAPQPVQRDVTMAEVAENMGVSVLTVSRWIAAGDLPAYKIGRNVRIRVADVEALKQSRRIRSGGGGSR